MAYYVDFCGYYVGNKITQILKIFNWLIGK